jgi:WD40 repeat protein
MKYSYPPYINFSRGKCLIFIVTKGWDKTLKVSDMGRGKVIASFAGDSSIYCLAISSSGRVALAGESSGRVHFLKLEGLK